MSYGSADLYVVEFPTTSVAATVTATLRDVASAGVVTLLDVALVRTLRDGTSELVELEQFADELGMVGMIPPATGLIGMDDIEEFAGDLTPGTSCLIVLMENTWARKITRAAREANARVIAVEHFPAEVVNEVAALAVHGDDDSMPFRRMGRPGLIGMAARTAVVVGTVHAASGRVARRHAAADNQLYPVQESMPASPATDDLVARLERLGQLWASGVLTPDEFVSAKARLLG
jgi:uncharacterized membrane protein